VFGKLIRSDARDRSKDVMDIRDMKRLKMAYQNGNLMATID
jgi:hypothetical protein